MNDHLLRVEELKTYFHTFEGIAKAVDDVSFSLRKGDVLGIVGESGCGKSVTAQSVMRLVPQPPGRIEHGRILFDGVDLLAIPMERMRNIRGKRISMIFQEPMTSLNPVYTIGAQISEMFIKHENLSKKESFQQSIEMLRKVQIPAPERRVNEYPHQLSGGMRQRAMIAMALACNPEILIADEPTTALDVTIQAQILHLIMKLRQDFEAAVIIITHDLGVIAEAAEQVIVMYAGKVVEQGSTVDIFDNPKHPYTRGLLESIPVLGARAKKGRPRLKEIPGIVPSLYDLASGCSFAPRCPSRKSGCLEALPTLIEFDAGHFVRCLLYA
ncbi:MAG TPA: ABC transporter ATP-binding protein [Desulfobacteraceae bacterium]|nr:ABC transporter ATP-binding protein [Desulfobacteraceae bacterium]